MVSSKNWSEQQREVGGPSGIMSQRCAPSLHMSEPQKIVLARPSTDSSTARHTSLILCRADLFSSGSVRAQLTGDTHPARRIEHRLQFGYDTPQHNLYICSNKTVGSIKQAPLLSKLEEKRSTSSTGFKK
jgi:hypothetical protein